MPAAPYPAWIRHFDERFRLIRQRIDGGPAEDMGHPTHRQLNTLRGNSCERPMEDIHRDLIEGRELYTRDHRWWLEDVADEPSPARDETVRQLFDNVVRPLEEGLKG